MRKHMGLYRGKRIDNGEWVEGFYYRATNNWTHENVHYITCFQDMLLTGETILTAQYEVDPDTVGECTSLGDKNGKLIFEGDILHSDEFFTAVVEWDSSHARFTLAIVYEAEIDDCVNLTCGKAGKLAVIGNVHDNPELLKGGEGE